MLWLGHSPHSCKPWWLRCQRLLLLLVAELPVVTLQLPRGLLDHTLVPPQLLVFLLMRRPVRQL